MGMRRAQHEGIGLTRAVDVVEVAAATGDEAPILDAANRLTDAELLHETLPPIRISEARIGFATPRGHGLTGNCSRPVSRSPVCPPLLSGRISKKTASQNENPSHSLHICPYYQRLKRSFLVPLRKPSVADLTLDSRKQAVRTHFAHG